MPRMIPFFLPDVDKRPRESVPVLNVVPAAAPYPVSVKIFRPFSPAAAAAGQIAFSTRPADSIDDPR